MEGVKITGYFLQMYHEYATRWISLKWYAFEQDANFHMNQANEYHKGTYRVHPRIELTNP